MFDANEMKELLNNYSDLRSRYFDLELELGEEEEDKLCDELVEAESKVVEMLSTIDGIDEHTAKIMVLGDLNKIKAIVDRAVGQV